MPGDGEAREPHSPRSCRASRSAAARSRPVASRRRRRRHREARRSRAPPTAGRRRQASRPAKAVTRAERFRIRRRMSLTAIRSVPVSVPEGAAGQVEEHGFEVGLADVDRSIRTPASRPRPRPWRRVSSAGRPADLLDPAHAAAEPRQMSATRRRPRRRGHPPPRRRPGRARRRCATSRDACPRRTMRPWSMIATRSHSRSASSM